MKRVYGQGFYFSGNNPRPMRMVEVWATPWLVKMSLQPAISAQELGMLKADKHHAAIMRKLKDWNVHDSWDAMRDGHAWPVTVTGSVRRAELTLATFKSQVMVCYDEGRPGNRGGPQRWNARLDGRADALIEKGIEDAKRKLAKLLTDLSPLELADLTHNHAV